jgi:hypothetical protein
MRIQLGFMIAFDHSQLAGGRDGIKGGDADAKDLWSEGGEPQVECCGLARQRQRRTRRLDLLLEQQLCEANS